MTPQNINRALVVAGVVVLVGLPMLLSQSLVNAAIQMLIFALFACAFNLLCGQAGLLSFGHAAYFGAGAFATVHAMNALGGAGLLPTALLPLMGALGGLVVGGIFGWFATQRSGTYFAMITLALAELVHAIAPQLRGLFGGEAGISSMRMPSWGFSFGSTNELYYTTLVWVLLSLAALYAYTLTPLGRLTLGLRENRQRLSFLGYDVHQLGVVTFALSAMFSGLAGGLQALNNEAANYAVFDAGLSSSVLLNTYIGGVGTFLGPALGAALMTFFGSAVSDMTRAWLLYQGILFVLVMMYLPTGLAGLVGLVARARREFGLARLLGVIALAIPCALLIAAGTVFLVELLQRVFSQDYRALARLNSEGGWPPIELLGRQWRPLAVSTWLVPGGLLLGGLLMLRVTRARWQALRDSAEAAPLAAASSVK